MKTIILTAAQYIGFIVLGCCLFYGLTRLVFSDWLHHLIKALNAWRFLVEYVYYRGEFKEFLKSKKENK